MIIVEKPAECGLFFIHLNHSVFIISPLNLFIEAFLGSHVPARLLRTARKSSRDHLPGNKRNQKSNNYHSDADVECPARGKPVTRRGCGHLARGFFTRCGH